jgi:AbrB family looped-hinge helix DNA binding protein
MPTSTITSEGQTTVPDEVREALALQPGDQITWTVAEGHVVVTRRPGLFRWEGFIKDGPDPVEAVAAARKTRGRV